MFLSKVGQDFEISFFKRSLNFCYDKDNGDIYASDLDTLEKLGVKTEIIDLNEEQKKLENKTKTEDECRDSLIKNIDQIVIGRFNELIMSEFTEILRKIEKLNEQVDSFKLLKFQIVSSQKQIVNLEETKTILHKSIKELLEYISEREDQQGQKQNEYDETLNTLKSSICILNKKSKETNEAIKDVNIKSEAIIQLISEQQDGIVREELPNVFKNGITIERIWNSTKDKSAAAILSIMLMLKKSLEEKGFRY